MGLRDYADSVSDRAGFRGASIPTRPHLARSVEIAQSRFDSGTQPATVGVDEVRKKLLQVGSTESWNQLGKREWNLSPWCLWGGEGELAADAGFLRKYLAEVRRMKSRRLVRHMISAYLSNFDARLQGVDPVAETIRAILPLCPNWVDRHVEFSLFDGLDAPVKIARMCIEGMPDDVLARVGIVPSIRFVGLDRAIYRAALQLFQASAPKSLIEQSKLSKLLDWSVEKRRLAYRGIQTELADTLLLPWTKAAPPDKTREQIQAFLLEHLKDPRIQPGNWHGVHDDAKAVMRRWLVQTTLEQFFQVVDQLEDEGRWRYRRKFWTSYLEENCIKDAWVVFARDGVSLTRQGLEKATGFGQFTGGANNNEAALLVQIGELTICEWSDLGKCRIWVGENSSKPDLSKHYYNGSELRAPADFEQAHMASDRGAWQGSIESFIRRHTGIRMTSLKYMPR